MHAQVTSNHNDATSDGQLAFLKIDRTVVRSVQQSVGPAPNTVESLEPIANWMRRKVKDEAESGGVGSRSGGQSDCR